MPERATDEDLDLLEELGVETAPVETGERTAREQRIIAGFEEIERFVEEHGRVPQHGESGDIFERLYAVRLDRIRESSECRAVLQGLDSRGLLGGDAADAADVGPEEDEELLAALGVEASSSDVTRMTHVRPREEIVAAEDVAKRSPCEDFEKYRPLFEAVQEDLRTGRRETVKYKEYADIKTGDLFVLDGQKVVVAESGKAFVSAYDRRNRRLKVIYDNGTESDLLLRSLQRALYKDKTSRRITEPGLGGLFSDVEDEEDLAAGSIYVLRSKSDHPFVAEHRSVLHKIGVTGGDVKSRVSGASKDPTYLLSDVEIVQTYKLSNINRRKLEAVLHRVFGAARLDLELKDRFGSQVEPEEWFLVPFAAIDEAIERIKDGTIEGVRYDPQAACFVRH